MAQPWLAAGSNVCVSGGRVAYQLWWPWRGVCVEAATQRLAASSANNINRVAATGSYQAAAAFSQPSSYHQWRESAGGVSAGGICGGVKLAAAYAGGCCRRKSRGV